MYQATRDQGWWARVHQHSFNALYARSLLYNACWEDPALDREAMRLDGDSEVLVITSAGCNALSYALDGPRRIHAVDANPRQTALLELKIAGIKHLDYEDFWALFGSGVHPGLTDLYRRHLRSELSPTSRYIWDTRLECWSGKGWRHSFYYHGLTGLVARVMSSYIRSRPRLRRGLLAMFRAKTLEEQAQLFETEVVDLLFPSTLRWLLDRQMTMHLLGVPYEQRRELIASHGAGVSTFVQRCITEVCTLLPMRDNYFWRVYVEGGYSRDCCPDYLQRDNFARLKAGAVESLRPATCTITDYLTQGRCRPSHLVLLDHMDWMGASYPDHLVEEWRQIFAHARPQAQVLFRSGAREPGFLDLPVESARGHGPLRDQLHWSSDQAAEMHQRDRVHTYASFHIGRLQPMERA